MRKSLRGREIQIAIAGGMLTLGGCFGGPEQIQPESFYARPQGPADVSRDPNDKSGALQYNGAIPQAGTPAPTEDDRISRTVAEGVLPPGQAIARSAATMPGGAAAGGTANAGGAAGSGGAAGDGGTGEYPSVGGTATAGSSGGTAATPSGDANGGSLATAPGSAAAASPSASSGDESGQGPNPDGGKEAGADAGDSSARHHHNWDQNPSGDDSSASGAVDQSAAPTRTDSNASGTVWTASGQGSATSIPGSTQPVGIASGQYMELGTMVAEVNGTPIFANKVLSLLEPTLRAKARELDSVRYKVAAEDFIQKQVRELVRSELEYAAATTDLDDDSRNAADALTTQWRQRQITDAGGSVELARRKAEADGVDFDDSVREQYRTFMTQIYYQKKVIPRIVVTPTMMREYYDNHVETDFTQHDHVVFRLIKIDPDASGGKDAALEKIKAIRERALAGEDFAMLASKDNDDEGLRSVLGEISVDKGAFILDDVEDAAFAAKPGDVTDIIYTHGAYYLAKVESKSEGKITPFTDPQLQDEIRNRLRAEQFRALREQEQEKLESEAIVRIDKDMIDATVEMAMQNYPVWSK